MRPGAVLRTITPDGELYFRECLKGPEAEVPYAEEDVARYPFVTPMISVNRIFREHGHQFIWDFDTMREALARIGFADVTKCRYLEGLDPKLLRDTEHRRVELLYVEARKPGSA